MGAKTRIAVLASGTGTNAENLMETMSSHWEIVGLICDNPHAEIVQKKEKWNIPFALIPFKKEESRAKENFEQALLRQLDIWQVDLICLAGFMRILSSSFLKRFYDKKWQVSRVINIHPSFLPYFPGKDAYTQAFKANALYSGVSIHFVNEKIDGGPVILQEKFKRDPSDDLASFTAKGRHLEYKLYPQALNMILSKHTTSRIRVLVMKKNKEEREIIRCPFYTIESPYLSDGKLKERLEQGEDVLHDSVLESLHFERPYFVKKPSHVVAITFRPGVTDNTAQTAQEALTICRLQGRVASGTLFFIFGKTDKTVEELAFARWGNPLVHLIQITSWEEFSSSFFSNPKLPHISKESKAVVEEIPLDLSDEELLNLSKSRHLALSVLEMKHIGRYFRVQKRWPTDVELEIIAQTWSEHCKHKIFNGQVDYREDSLPRGCLPLGNKKINSLFKTFIKGATEKLDIPWTVSLFHDNAGIVRFDSQIDLAIKVETHNGPSALDPYGGALTGILGVNRDILGCGMGAKPIANMDVFCLAPPSWPSKEEEYRAPMGVPLPYDVLVGVHKGVEDGGNKSGIPTVGGGFYFDGDYAGRPLVFCGTVGVLPRKLPDGREASCKYARVGDRIVMIGGAIGADGIHGATSSSLQLDESTPVSMVQIGNPLVQKRMADFLLIARDKGLYSSITDNGAGGLSSSVGEMATATGGASLDLSLCPVKYPGLKPYELMISESQERMTLAVPPEKINDFLSLAEKMDVSATDLGHFDDSGYLIVTYKEKIVARLSLNFLHESLPPLQLKAVWDGPRKRPYWGYTRRQKNFEKEKEKSDFYQTTLLSLLSSYNIKSKENWLHRYDHQVQGATCQGPYAGLGSRKHIGKGKGPGDGALVWLYPHGGEKKNIIALGCGMAPLISVFDPYLMAQFAVDEAIRNVVASGGDPETCCLLDNFSWPDPVESRDNPEGTYKMGQLVRACQGLHDICLAYKTPLVSGKDSMKNNFKGKNRRGDPISMSILPTLLVTAMAKGTLPFTCTTPFKREGSSVYLLGQNSHGLEASEFSTLFDLKNQPLPSLDISLNKKLYTHLHKAIKHHLISSCHDLSEGGLMVALTESIIGGSYGAVIDLNLDEDPIGTSEFLFGEAPGRFIVSVYPESIDLFEKHFKEFPCTYLGQVKGSELIVNNRSRSLINVNILDLENAWRSS